MRCLIEVANRTLRRLRVHMRMVVMGHQRTGCRSASVIAKHETLETVEKKLKN